MAPLRKLTGQFLNDIDLMIRSLVKEILMIPNDSPTSMIYASKNIKDWEFSGQHGKLMFKTTILL